jgi:CRISPR-associated exonuclease Cas4
MDRQGHLAVVDLLNHRYCARITWFAYVLGLKQRGTVKTTDGVQRHESWVGRERNRWREGASVMAGKKVISAEICSERLGLRGRMDALVGSDGAMRPYEVKATRRPDRPYPGQLTQLAAYALLLEDRDGHPVDSGFLHYMDGDSVEEHAITQEMKADVLGLLQDVQNVVMSETMPIRAAPTHCRDCVYSKICT